MMAALIAPCCCSENCTKLMHASNTLAFRVILAIKLAVSAGLHYATGDLVAVMDADLQDPPEELCRFIDKWREGY